MRTLKRVALSLAAAILVVIVGIVVLVVSRIEELPESTLPSDSELKDWACPASVDGSGLGT